MNNLVLEKVWISSIEHLDQMHNILNNRSWWQKLIGYMKINAGFPQVSIYFFSFPVVFYSKGQLQVDSSKIIFNANIKQTIRDSQYKNVDNNLMFDISLDSIEEILMYKYPKPYMENFNYPWVQIKLKNNQTFLISSEKEAYNIKQGIQETEMLYTFLMKNKFNN